MRPHVGTGHTAADPEADPGHPRRAGGCPDRFGHSSQPRGPAIPRPAGALGLCRHPQAVLRPWTLGAGRRRCAGRSHLHIPPSHPHGNCQHLGNLAWGPCLLTGRGLGTGRRQAWSSLSPASANISSHLSEWEGTVQQGGGSGVAGGGAEEAGGAWWGEGAAPSRPLASTVLPSALQGGSF